MKRANYYLSLSLIFALSGTLSAQSADDILAKLAEIRGDMQKLASTKTLKYSGTFVERGLNANLALYFKSPNKIYFHLKMGEIIEPFM